MAFSRSCIQLGLGPLRTLRISRPTNSGHAEAVSPVKSRLIAGPATPTDGTGSTRSGLSLPMPAAARSRATPRTDRQSARSGVTAMSITGPSIPSALAAAAADLGILRQVDDAVMLLAELQLAHRAQHALADHAADRGPLQHLAALGDHQPLAGENALHAGAGVGSAAAPPPASPSPVSTVHSRSRSACGCGRAAETWPTTKPSSGAARSSMLSTSRPSAGQRLGDALGRSVGLEMVLEPGQSEFHRDSPA